MAQFSSATLRKALGELEADGNGGQPALRPEQVERITALSKETDPEVKARKTVELGEELVREAHAASAKLEGLLKDFGIDPAQASAFLSGGKLSDDARTEAGQARAAYEAQVQGEIEQAARAVQQQGRGAKAPRPGGRMRV
jgi:hypothetical protein